MFRNIAIGCAVGSAASMSDIGCGQEYPTKPIRIITSSAGSGDDLQARMISQRISAPLGQPVIVDYRPSLGAIDLTAKANPDGYSIILSGSNIWLAPLLQKVSWDPLRDFAPITATDMSPNALAIHPTFAAKSVKELIAIAKTRPGEINYASGPLGGGAHLGAELFKSLAGVHITRVPYKSGGAAMTALVGGEVQIQFAGAANVLQHLKAGRLRVLAVTSPEPTPFFPGVPTVAATVPGYEAVSYTAVFAPAKTPEVAIRRLNQEIVRVLNTPDFKEQLFSLGVQTYGTTPEALAMIMKNDMARMAKVIRDAGIKVE